MRRGREDRLSKGRIREVERKPRECGVSVARVVESFRSRLIEHDKYR